MEHKRGLATLAGYLTDIDKRFRLIHERLETAAKLATWQQGMAQQLPYMSCLEAAAQDLAEDLRENGVEAQSTAKAVELCQRSLQRIVTHIEQGIEAKESRQSMSRNGRATHKVS